MHRRGVRQFIKFGIVGASGMVVNFVVAHALEKTTRLSWFADFAIGFMVGGVSNYFLNRVWTFGSRRNALVEGLQFLAVSAIALLVGKVVFTIAGRTGFHHFTATWFAATLSGVFVNFFLNKYWTFRHLKLRTLGTSGYWAFGLLGVLVVALVLRLHGISDPILDHPGWRQGDTAAIARNFYRLRFDIMYPQTLYNGPPPNYVELELQIVPFLAAVLYKLLGVHESFGRIISLAFSLATVAVLAYFARWLFGSAVAGLVAAFFYAIFPGSVYYGRTFMPDCAMVFFLTAALYVAARYLVENRTLSVRGLTGTTALLTLAYLAKPVASLAVVPLLGMLVERARAGRTMRPFFIAILIAVPFAVLTLYDRRVDSYAEWHWASGIARLHVLPALRDAVTSAAGFEAQLDRFGMVLGLLRDRLLGSLAFGLALAGFVALPWIPSRSKALLWGWLAGALAYTYVVVTVERVDYYMYPLLPLCALVIGAGIARFVAFVRAADVAPSARYALLALVPIVAITALWGSRAPVEAYYRYNNQAYRNAVELDGALAQNALVVIGHYGPDVQYYIDRFGWEEDPALWTPFDEESAVGKGARYFISIEDNRLRNNLELCAWLQRFPIVDEGGAWPVYETDPAKVAPTAEAFWRSFRNAERDGRGRAFLDARGLCRVKAERFTSARSH